MSDEPIYADETTGEVIAPGEETIVALARRLRDARQAEAAWDRYVHSIQAVLLRKLRDEHVERGAGDGLRYEIRTTATPKYDSAPVADFLMDNGDTDLAELLQCVTRWDDKALHALAEARSEPGLVDRIIRNIAFSASEWVAVRNVLTPAPKLMSSDAQSAS